MNLLVPSQTALALCLLTTTSALAQVSWTLSSPTGAPRALGGSAWDTARNRLVAFGGEQGTTQFNQTTEWNGTAWAVVTTAQQPSVRRRPAMAYDAARGVVVLFGGGAGTSTFLNDTWTYNGTTWTQRFPLTSPSTRFGAAMAYDAERQVIVMHGGFVPSGQDSSETWEWNGTTWTLRSSGSPSARGAHRMTFDAARGVVLMSGGYSTLAQTTLDETWLWDGSAWSFVGTSGAGTLCDQLLVNDPHRQRVVMFGGLRLNGAQTPIDLNTTWEWDGAAWTQRTMAQVPPGRSSAAVGFDPTTGGIVLGGGVTGGGFQFSNTFTYRPTSPAATTTFGTGCPTTTGPVGLTARSLPYVGLNFDQRITGAPAAALLGIIVFGNSNTLWGAAPLPLSLASVGAAGCNLNVSVDVPATVPLGGGVGDLTWTLPNLPAAVGVQFFTQAFVFDPASPLQFPIGASVGRGFTIGAP
ncbi:MAG: hypothetical protein MUC36_07740 [Planctomycetes bacterium]|jgi:hypothetical protein|nr:hypothetical protein [Planctomycetota bacterium]